ncbi:hypothetical protein HYDPIDRAFT_107023 [Hydnomerulius pinastri MD-312]|nr:hypothetical protein HYDPIDRAFT_107023 [Hydnomerulius pinastri MD-312]
MASSDGPWSCRISIRWEFDDKGQLENSVSEVPFGDVIRNKEEVELALRRAQAAVLHPGTPATQFLGLSTEELRKVKSHSLPFSRNVVCIDLEGPDLTDLSFIDLPGIIQNAEPEIVRLVEDVVTSSIKGNTIILVALPMTDDIENQKALRLAQTEDSAGRRTIGVLTKPDQLAVTSTKALANWLEVLDGHKHQLLHGYYCTRQPDDVERTDGITPTEARAAEAKFFSSTTPWSKTTCPERLGTGNLVEALSVHLVRLINDMLPKFRLEAGRLYEECTERLADIPPAIEGDPANHVMNLVAEFCTTVDQYVRGGAGTSSLIQCNRMAFAQFKADIRSTAPNFRPFTTSDATKHKNFRNALDDGGDEGTEEGLRGLSLAEPFFLDDMRTHIKKSVTRELPNNVPFVSKVVLINGFQKHWGAASTKCSEQVRTTLSKFLNESIKQHFARHEALKSYLMITVQELSAQHYTQCLTRIQEHLEIEQDPFTQNDHYLESCKERWLAHYKDARAGQSTPAERVAKRVKLDCAPLPIDNSASAKPAAAAPEFPSSFWNVNMSPTTSSSKPFSFDLTDPDTATHPAAKPASVVLNRTMHSARGKKKYKKKKGRKFAYSVPAPATASTGKPAVASEPSHTESLSGTPASAPPAPWTNPPPLDNVAPTKPPAFATPPPPEQEPEAEAEALRTVLANLAKLGHTVTEEDLVKLLPSEEYEDELHVMAEVRGYFQVAYKRMIDNIPLLLDHLFTKAVARHLQPFLITKLGIGSADSKDRLAMYLEEDPHVVARRVELVARKTRLEAVETELQTFGL